jgi:hypothetical protein
VIELDKVLSEVYACVTAMGEKYTSRIPEDIWENIEKNKNDNYNPIVDADKRLSEQGFMEDTITFIAMLYRDYWCDTEEKMASLLAMFAQNEAEWQAKVASTGSVRDRLKMVHKDE